MYDQPAFGGNARFARYIFEATWPSGLRRLIRNQMGNTRVGSNPAVVDPYTLGYMYFYKKKICIFPLLSKMGLCNLLETYNKVGLVQFTGVTGFAV